MWYHGARGWRTIQDILPKKERGIKIVFTRAIRKAINQP